jgi:small subunit ribosomal protein S17
MLWGVVTSDKQNKTVTVEVERRFAHPLFKKTVRRTKKYHAHDENNECKIGDRVWIEETKPMSRTKTWIVKENETQKKAGLTGKIEVLTR